MTQPADSWASSPEELAQLRTMNVTLHSGARVTLRTITLDELIADEALPDDLVYIAVLEGAEATIPEMARQMRDRGDDGVARVREMSRDLLAMRDRLVVRSLVGYDNGDAEKVVAALDGYDKELIAELAQRKRIVDAEGRRVGADTLARFRGDDPQPAVDQAGTSSRREAVDVPDVQPRPGDAVRG